MAFLSSTYELPGGGYEREIPEAQVWEMAAADLGLLERDYGKTWFVYESKAEYLESLD